MRTISPRHVARRLSMLLILLVSAAVLWPVSAQAAAPKTPVLTDVSVPIMQAPNMAFEPHGWKISAGQAFALAQTAPKLLAIHRVEHPLSFRVLVVAPGHYEIYFWFRNRIVADQVVFRNGTLGPTYTDGRMFATYARGHYGGPFDSPFVWLTLTLAFVFALLTLRGISWLGRLDLAAVLTFGISYGLFDHQHLTLSVWMAYPPLLYIIGRLLWRGCRQARAPGEVRSGLPTWLLAGGLLLLCAGRVWLALANPTVMDVGEASAIGAYKLVHGQSIYYASLGHGDTYGPIAYLVYAPFQLIWPGDNWNSFLPSIRAATIVFDLLTTGGLVLLGRRLRAGREGLRLGLLLAWLWAACPFSAMGIEKNTNDGLVALAAVVLLLVMARPLRRGAVIALAAMAKFFPAILLPLVAVGDGRGGRQAARLVGVAFTVVCGLTVAIFLPPGGLQELWSHTIGYQLTRADVFSPWAMHPGLSPLKDVVEVAVAGLAALLAFRPRGPRTIAQISALAGALVIGTQLTAMHWFYLYIVWFLPFLFVAVLAPAAVPAARPALPELDGTVTALGEPELVGA